jgi:hypothetical protein
MQERPPTMKIEQMSDEKKVSTLQKAKKLGISAPQLNKGLFSLIEKITIIKRSLKFPNCHFSFFLSFFCRGCCCHELSQSRKL